MNTATPAQDSRKRVRFEELNNLIDKNTNNAPSKKAREILKEAVVALLPAIRALTEFFFEKVIKLHIGILHLTSKAEKMKESSTIPKSARTNFKLTSKYKESDARTTLETKVEEYKATYQTNLKETILAAMEIDIQSLKKDLQDTLCEAFFQLGHIFAIQQSNNEITLEDKLHKQILRIVANTPNIIKHSFTNVLQFESTYKNKFNIMSDSEDIPTDTTVATDVSVLTDGEEMSLLFARSIGDFSHRRRSRTVVTETTNIEPSNNDPLNADSTRVLSTLLYQAFSKPWSIYEHEHKLRLLNNLLNKHSTSVITTNSTDQAAGILNSEPSIDPTMLKDIINTEVKKATRELTKQINKLQQTQQRSKNLNRGNSKASAGEKKNAINKEDQEKNSKRKKITTNKQKQATKSKKPTKKDQKDRKLSNKKSNKKHQEAAGEKGQDSQKRNKRKQGSNQKKSSKKKKNSTRK
jgi:hypothetical protein